ncbi:MAG TPA: hypothetical protein VGL72_11495, partial [Bryobacteraceae bacterium]
MKKGALMTFHAPIASSYSALVVSALLSLCALPVAAQSPCTGQKSQTIACLTLETIGQAFGGNNNNVPFPTYAGYGNQNGNAYLVAPLTASQPIPSPASGFVYAIDPSSGAYVRSSDSFGPILSERADTIGVKKLFLGATFQRFVFDKVDGLNAHALVYSNLAQTGLTGTINADLQLNQYTMFATYGVTDRIDVSLAIPISSVRYGVGVTATAPGSSTILSSASASHIASGLGDIDFEVKGTVLRRQKAAVAVGTVFRMPTGDPYEALGAGSLGVKPFVAGSINYKHISPHLNIGYLFNGKSILTGNILTGERRQIPDQANYAAGVDSGLNRWLTVAFDVLGTEVIHGDRATTLTRLSYNMTNGSVGFKLSPGGTFLVVVNALFPINSGSGLRTKFSPLIGLS